VSNRSYYYFIIIRENDERHLTVTIQKVWKGAVKKPSF